MSLEAIFRRIPVYAKSVCTNLEHIYLSDALTLSQQQTYFISLAICYAIKNEQLLNSLRNEAKLYLEEAHFAAAKIAPVVSIQDNVLLNFINNCDNLDIKDVKVDLKKVTLTGLAVDKTEFEMALLGLSIATQSLLGIKVCLQKLTNKAVSIEMITDITRIAVTLRTVAEVLEIEMLRNYDFVPRGENI